VREFEGYGDIMTPDSKQPEKQEYIDDYWLKCPIGIWGRNRPGMSCTDDFSWGKPPWASEF